METTQTNSQVEAALEELRPGLVADGSDIQLVDVTGGVATLRLVLAEDACLECIVPKDSFEAILNALLVGKVPDVSSVRLIDPREN